MEQNIAFRQDPDAIEQSYEEWLAEIGSRKPTAQEVEAQYRDSLAGARLSQLAFAL